MTPDHALETEMHDLLAALREDELTAAQAERLQTLVINHEPARKLYVQSMQLHADLRWQCADVGVSLDLDKLPQAAAASESDASRERTAAMPSPQTTTPRWPGPLAIAAALVAVAAVIVSVIDRNATPPATDEGEVSPAPMRVVGKPDGLAKEQAVLAKLTKPLAADYDGVPMEDVLKDIATQTGIGLIVNWEALEHAGVANDTPVSLQLSEVPGDVLLRLALQAVSVSGIEPIRYSMRDGVVHVSTDSDLSSNVETRIYDIRDLIAYSPIASKAPEFGLENALDSGVRQGPVTSVFGEAPGETGIEKRVKLYADSVKGTGPLKRTQPRLPDGANQLARRNLTGDRSIVNIYDIRDLTLTVPEVSKTPGRSNSGGVFGTEDYDEEEAYTRVERAEMLVQAVRDLIKPEDWMMHGGEHASIRELDGAAIVSATPEAHREIDQLFAQLREFHQAGGEAPGPVAIPEPPVIPEPEVDPEFNREAYDYIVDNPFLAAMDNPLSTFSIDVDTASYANTRRMIRQGMLPPYGAVRVEELVNYFPYRYDAKPAGDDPFAASTEVAACPWAPRHKLVRVALKGKEIEGARPTSNLVFLLDVSGSMDEPNKLPLLKDAFRMLVNELADSDRVAIVVYAGASGLVLDSTHGRDKLKILDALDKLNAGGSTNGGEGIRLAYQLAERNFIKDGTNRVILATDGDFNVGTTSDDELVRLIEEKRETGVFLSVLGFGDGNLQDTKMEKLADHGNGNYSYIDTQRKAQKVLIEQMAGTLVTIAKDVKIQIEFNPAKVASYRLIGYENRILAAEDFNDDTKDAGEIGAGHTVTALYEVVTTDQAAAAREREIELLKLRIRHVTEELELLEAHTPEMASKQAELATLQKLQAALDKPDEPEAEIDPLKYQQVRVPTEAAASNELLTLKLRYKQPDGDVSTKIEVPVRDGGGAFAAASEDYRFAAAVAAFGMILRDSPHKGAATFKMVQDLAGKAIGQDAGGYRAEFVELVGQARTIHQQQNPVEPKN